LDNFGAVSLTTAPQVKGYVSADYLATLGHNLLLHSIQRLPLPQACWESSAGQCSQTTRRQKLGLNNFATTKPVNYNPMNGPDQSVRNGSKQDGMFACFAECLQERVVALRAAASFRSHLIPDSQLQRLSNVDKSHSGRHWCVLVC
jgi:hypothetical protein